MSRPQAGNGKERSRGTRRGRRPRRLELNHLWIASLPLGNGLTEGILEGHGKGTSGGRAPLPARLNIGAVNAAGLEWGVRPGFQNSQVSAQCVDGVLKISRPKSPSLRQRGGWLEAQRVRSANLFYADVEADAVARVGALLGLPGFGQLAPPLDGVVEIGRSPVHRTR